MNWNQYLPYLAPALVVIMLVRRTLRAQQPRRIRPGLLWIQPAILLVGMISLLAVAKIQFSPLAVGIFAAGAIAGALVGYFRALHQEFSIDPETGNVMSKATPLGTLLFLGIFIVRFGMNAWMNGGQQADMRHPMSANVLLYTDATLCFAFAMVAATAFEIYRRTRPVLAEQKAAQSTPPLP